MFGCRDKWCRPACDRQNGTIILVLGGMTTFFATQNKVVDEFDRYGLFSVILKVVIDLTAGAYADTTSTGPEWKLSIICSLANKPFINQSIYNFQMRAGTARLWETLKWTRTCKSPKPTKSPLYYIWWYDHRMQVYNEFWYQTCISADTLGAELKFVSGSVRPCLKDINCRT